MENAFSELVSMLVPFVAVVFGLVEFFKASFKLEGQAVTVMSFIVGALGGALVLVAYLVPGADVYVAGAIFVLASGLVASGYYKFLAERVPRLGG